MKVKEPDEILEKINESLYVFMLGVDGCIHNFNLQTQKTECGIELMKNQPKSGGDHNWCSLHKCSDF